MTILISINDSREVHDSARKIISLYQRIRFKNHSSLTSTENSPRCSKSVRGIKAGSGRQKSINRKKSPRQLSVESEDNKTTRGLTHLVLNTHFTVLAWNVGSPRNISQDG